MVRTEGGARRPWAPAHPGLLAARVAAGCLVVAGVAAQVVRPLAPDIGPVLDPTTWFDAAHLARVQEYRGPRYAAAVLTLVLRLAVPLALVLTRPGRRLVERAVQRLSHRPGLAAGLLVAGALAATDVVLFPLAYWFGFVHEGAFGFRTQGFGGWLYDWFVGRAPAWLAALALVPAAYALVRRLPRAWPAVAGLLMSALIAVVVMASPLVLEPLSFRFEPLPEGPLRVEIERLLERAGQPVDEIVVADASRRTTKQNAYVSGLGTTRRVVLYDTLVEQRPPAEVGVILAHELGHDAHADLARGVAAGGAAVIALCYLLAAVLRAASRRGRLEGPADPRGAVLALALVIVLDVASQPVEMWLSRRAEAAADYAALELTQDPETYLASKQQLARANLSDPLPPRWAYLMWSSHPAMAERLTMGERWPFTEP